MRAMAVVDYARPLEPLELPEPELGPGTALLEVLTCGICFSDVKTSRGKMPFSDRVGLPHVPGHEICARVLATDPPGELEGATVVVYHLWPCRRCDRCRAGEENLCRNPRGWTGFTQHGGLRERMVAPLDRLVEVPSSIDPVHAAPLTCALGTGYRAVVSRGRVRPGAKVAVIGLGGVGIHALQVARAAGAHAIGIDVSERALQAAQDVGCESVAPAELELDQSFDVVLDVVGTEATLTQALGLVRAGGRIVAVGYSLTSSFVVPSPRFVLEEVELVGSRYVRMHELQRAISLVAAGDVQMVVDRVLPLAEADAAMEQLAAGGVVGRVVVDVAGS